MDKSIKIAKKPGGRSRGAKSQGHVYSKSVSPTPTKYNGPELGPRRTSPIVRMPDQSHASTPRFTEYYAGCKFTEPPAPSTLPPPPQHWLQKRTVVRAFSRDLPAQPSSISTMVSSFFVCILSPAKVATYHRLFID